MGQATPENQGEVVVPSVAASREVEASVKPKRSRRTRWNNDGPTDEVSSLSVLLDWLTTEGNCARWRGGGGHSGETKAAFASQIATLIESQGVTTEKDREIKTCMHTEQLEWERQRFAQTARLEERKMNCAEQETQYRVMLLQAQAKREQAMALREEELTKREKLQTKAELARCRNRLRKEGVIPMQSRASASHSAWTSSCRSGGNGSAISRLCTTRTDL